MFDNGGCTLVESVLITEYPVAVKSNLSTTDFVVVIAFEGRI